ncbi:MAG TPA: regulatory protein RecX [Bacteroidales bacterium]|nr:regulatory protein RecX [Bacteroidales bacterium]HQQ11849.1 regulatory protein RecX [Bacteroidales bacterium]
MSEEFRLILHKARQYCDYQERCISEVKDKLRSWQVKPEISDKIILSLEEENYIDEDRYVRAFALGKLRNNQWGRNKIMYLLRQKDIPEIIIEIGLQEIDSEEYLEILKKLLKNKKTKAPNAATEKAKLAQYAIGKGFQPHLVWQLLNEKE